VRFWWKRRGNRTTGFRDHGENLAMADLTAALAARTALTIRFVKEGTRWVIFVSMERREVPIRTDAGRGAMAIDINPKQLDWARVDAEGNLMASGSHPIRHRSHACAGQVAASIGDAVVAMVAVAEQQGVPLVTEDLDFTAKKRALRDAGVRQRAMLSGFAYRMVLQAVASRCHRRGIEHRSVNPAFSSLIGCAGPMSLYGMHSGTAAALVLARRALGLSERMPRRLQVTVPCPADGGTHVWSRWRLLARAIMDARRRHTPIRRHAWFAPRRALSPAVVTLSQVGRRRRTPHRPTRASGKDDGSTPAAGESPDTRSQRRSAIDGQTCQPC
jgi:IS605 OrfB family transposase